MRIIPGAMVVRGGDPLVIEIPIKLIVPAGFGRMGKERDGTAKLTFFPKTDGSVSDRSEVIWDAEPEPVKGSLTGRGVQ